jgi:hypothetical protein
MYSAALQQLLGLYRGDPALRALPLVVNMDGWVRGCVRREKGGAGKGREGGS